MFYIGGMIKITENRDLMVNHLQDVLKEKDIKLTKSEIKSLLIGLKEATVRTLVEMTDGESIVFPGLLSLTKTLQAEKEARNPATGEKITVAEGFRLKSSLSSVIKKDVKEMEINA